MNMLNTKKKGSQRSLLFQKTEPNYLQLAGKYLASMVVVIEVLYSVEVAALQVQMTCPLFCITPANVTPLPDNLGSVPVATATMIPVVESVPIL